MRFPRKAVMVSFLRACGIPEDRMEPWRRAWDRAAACEQDLFGTAPSRPAAKEDQPTSSDVHTTRAMARGRTGGLEVPVTRDDTLSAVTDGAPVELAAKNPQDLADRKISSRPVHGPMVRRRELSALLRALRVGANMTIEEVAERLLCSPSKVSRMETGARSPTFRDIRDLCDLYGIADAQRQDLVELARESRQQGWWQSYDLPFATFIGLEADATSIDIFEASIIPGLLQTPDYARAIIEGTAPEPSPELIEQGVAVRVTRQRLLTQDDPPQLRVIIDEAALWRVIGNPSLMKAQLNHLVEVSSLPHVGIQVIPFRAGAFPAVDSSFTILELPDPIPGVIYVEGLFGFVYLERPQDVERYRRTFQDTQSIAATEPESIALISRISKELDAE